MIVLLVALGAAAMAALLLGGFFGKRNEAVAAAGPQVQMTEVLVAARDLDIGTVVGPDDIKWQKWPTDAVAGGYLTKDSAPQGLETMIGAVARTTMFSGEPVSDVKLVRAESSNFMAATLSPGMRAVSVEISEQTSAGGFIKPNDRVDVILTANAGNSDDGLKRAVTRTLLQGIRVLAVGQTFRDSAGTTETTGETQQVAKTATLEVSPAEAEILQQGTEMGTVSLALRGLTSSDKPIVEIRVPAGSAGREQRRGGAITIIRFGEVTQIQSAR
jgi:pilus assembly protein CpaB